MFITIKEAVKIARAEAEVRGLVLITVCNEVEDGWNFSFSTKNSMIPIPGSGFFYVNRDGETRMNYSRIFPPKSVTNVRSINIKEYLLELGEPYISLEEAVEIAYNQVKKMLHITSSEFAMSYIFIPECFDNIMGTWTFFITSKTAYLGIQVNYYGKTNNITPHWWDLPLPDYKAFDGKQHKINIAEYIKNKELY